MKNAKFYSIISALLVAAVIFVSCKDDFTEEDALDAQQTIAYNVVVQDANSKAGIDAATVTIVQDGENVEATTNAQGVATFKGIKIGSAVPVTIKKDGFGVVNTTADLSGASYRQGEESSNFYLLSLTENIATVRGKVEIETDLTNSVREKVGTGKVTATLIPSSYNNVYLQSKIVVEATIAADGTYELKLPTFGTGVNYSIVANDLEVDQKISYNSKIGEAAFPATLPKTETIKTVFSSGGGTVAIPSVPAVFATVDGTSTTPAVLAVETNSQGKISSVYLSGSGGTGYTGTSANITITSLLGGTGAKATATITGGVVTGFTIDNATATGYPYQTASGTPYAPKANNNVAPAAALNVVTPGGGLAVKPNDIKVRNIFYGTGSSRAIEIQ